MHTRDSTTNSKKVDRDSGEFGVERVNYGNVEIASEVGWDAYKRVADEIHEDAR